MSRYSSLLLLAVLTVAFAGNFYQTFDDYVNEHDHKFVSPAERTYRSKVYESNVKNIIAHNNDPSSTDEHGINQFTIWTHAEFVKNMLTVRETADMKKMVATATPIVGATWNPTAIEYTLDSKKITSVKDQANCGSCWAFATIASIESLSFMANGTVRDFSEQQLVSCSSPYGNQGCNGGWPYGAFNYIQAYGLVNETDYPYTSGIGGVTGSCLTAKTTKQAVKIGGYTNVTVGCVNVAASLLARPLVVGVDATDWSPYSSGIFKCAIYSVNVNHAVLLVGVNSTTWKVKNQWGTGWGVAGFMTIDATGGFNACRICNFASYPVK